jgi:hypothetical protein
MKKLAIGAFTSLAATIALPFVALAAPKTTVVTPANLQGWQEYPGSGQLSFVKDATSPLPKGALQLDTPNTADEVQIDRSLKPTAINDVTNMSYSAKRVAGANYASPAYIVGVDTDNDDSADIYAWYEPVYNVSANTNFNKWQTFNLDSTTTKFWSFTAIDNNGHGGANGSNFFTLKDVENADSNAKIVELTLNTGSGTPGWSVRTDNVTFNDSTWDFEQTNVPSNKNDCKNGGYANYTDTKGTAFKNQGDCVSFVAKKNGNNGNTSTTTTTNTTNTTVTNNNNVSVTNSNTQNATSGSVKIKGNQSSGSATSGNSSNSSGASTPVTISNGKL